MHAGLGETYSYFCYITRERSGARLCRVFQSVNQSDDILVELGVRSQPRCIGPAVTRALLPARLVTMPPADAPCDVTTDG